MENRRLETDFRWGNWIERLSKGKPVIQPGDTKTSIQDKHDTVESICVKRWGLKKPVMLKRFLRSFRTLAILIMNFYREIVKF